MRAPLLPVLTAAALLLLAGCKPHHPVDRAYATCTAPGGGRTAAAGQLAADWRAQKLKLEDAINHAFDLLDAVKAGTRVKGAVPTSMDATAFAGAVLDATLVLDRDLPKDGTAELFWMRVGGLAFAAAEEARAAGRGPEALALSLGGNRRWQNEAYWHMHPTHDGLVSWLLVEAGDREKAVARLRNRANLDGFALETYKRLGGGF